MAIQFSSIKRSMLLIVLIVTTLALLIAFTINTYSQVQHYRDSLIERSVAYARVTAFNALSSVVFDDNETETQRLRSLRSTSFVEHVHIYKLDEVTGDLNFFASYNRRGLAPIPAKYASINNLGEPRIVGNHLEVAEPIQLDNSVVGYVYLRSSMTELNDFVQRSIILAVIVTFGTLLLAALLTIRMRKTITRPLDRMVEVIQQVAREKDYSLRLPNSHLQEVDSVSHAFNIMLNRIQQHITRQEKAEQEASLLASELEQQVSQRTQALKEANSELLKTLEQLHLYQSQLVESEKMASLGDMVAGIAHEVNTPIGLSVTASTLLQDKLHLMQEKFSNKRISTQEFERFLNDCDENLAIIYRNVNRAADLITAFKQVAVDQSSEVDRQILVVDFMQDVLLSIKPRLKDSTKFPIHIHCDPTLQIETKPGPLNQILSHLITNSMVHGFDHRQQGEVNISISVDTDKRLEIVYEDNGAGVPMDIRRRIFDPFVTSKRGSGGSGLGMHLVYNLVTQVLKGNIHFFSEQEQGVEFVVRFPVTVLPPAKPNEPPATEAQS
ncbi:MAG: ATP-binding protein [Idiomarina sp.]